MAAAFSLPERAVEHALRLLDEGADILDIGGESTRPGRPWLHERCGAERRCPAVTEDEELRRVMPVMRGHSARASRRDALHGYLQSRRSPGRRCRGR